MRWMASSSIGRACHTPNSGGMFAFKRCDPAVYNSITILNKAMFLYEINPSKRQMPLKVCCSKKEGVFRGESEKVDTVVRLYNISVPISKDPGKDDFSVHKGLLNSIKSKLKLKTLTEENVSVVRKAFDSRRRDGKKWIYVVDISIDCFKGKKIVESQGKLEIIRDYSKNSFLHDAKPDINEPKDPIVVIGSGPAGLFAALAIAKSGASVVLLERGRPVEDRGKDIGALFVRSRLDPESNLCYGEGGAGTWSDGKLTTRIGRNDDPVRQVLDTFVMLGAPEEILYTGKPHLGTDRLIRILQAFRNQLKGLGVDIRFSTKVTEICAKNNRVCGVMLDDGTEIKTEKCILAIGHSARGMYNHLADMDVHMESKPFAMGFRIEHPQSVIDTIQYGKQDAQNLVLRGKGPIPVADYRLTCNLEDGRGVYSFCMCPGGQIVPTSTNEKELCINGMSFSRRNSVWANSAMVTTVGEKDFEPFYGSGHKALSGVMLQKHIEREAALMGGGNFVCPVQKVADFLSDTLSDDPLPSSSYRLGVKSAPLHSLYSPEITLAIKEALYKFDKMKPGFICDDALLHAAGMI